MSPRHLGLGLAVALGLLIAPVIAAEPVLLRYKFAKGEKLVYRTLHEEKQVQTIGDQKIETATNQNVVSSRVVDAVDARGNATLKSQVVRRKMSVDGPGGKFVFDSKSSERDTSSEIGGTVTPILERLTGSEYEIKMSPRGNVLEVKGFAELIADLVKDKPGAALQAGIMADNDGAKHSEQEEVVVFSEKPVEPGDSWEESFEVELKGVGKVKGKVFYTYEADDKVGDRKTVRIGVKTDVTVDLDVDAMGAKVTGMVSTNSSEGVVQFDPAAGRVVAVKHKMSMSGQLTVNAGGMVIPVDNFEEHVRTTELLSKLPE
ncbi:MAG TPA: DUF6263 family protein [Planctomycetaceae bacterium]|nr:DUF6263 family protein [Planctomycetaceae bacterium]